MIIFLYGPDSYRRKRNLKSIVSKYKEKHENADLERFDLGEDDSLVQDIKDFLKQPSMFASSKIVVVEEGTSVRTKDWIETLKSYTDSKEAFIIVSDSTKKPVKKFRFLLDDSFKTQKFEDLKGDKLRGFIKKQAEKNNIKLSRSAFDYLVSYIGSHKGKSWLSVNEVKKIAFAGFDEPVSKKDVKKLIDWTPQDKMFGHVKRMFNSRSVPQKLIVLESLLSRDKHHVFNTLGIQVRGASSKKLADLDVDIKSGSLEHEEALLDFILD